MPKLLAIIPEDGWAMVQEGETIFFVRPPFRKPERVPISGATLADAIAAHGYEAQVDAPVESWADVIERIHEAMVSVNKGKNLPSDGEILSRMLRSGPPSVLTGLLDTVEHEWLARGDLKAAERALKALFVEDRVKNNKALLDRALQARRKLDELYDEKDLCVPARLLAPRIDKIARRPEVVKYKTRQRSVGAAWMVSVEA